MPFFPIVITGGALFVFGQLAWHLGRWLGLGAFAACVIVLAIAVGAIVRCFR